MATDTRPTAPTAGPVPRAFAIFEALTVGLPFCAFKVILGIFLLASPALLLGWLLLALGAIDAVLNLVNVGALAARGRRVGPICFATFLVARTPLRARAESVGTAIDMLLAFGLVALALGGGLLPHFEPAALAVWNGAVVVNVLGAGLLRLLGALRDE